MKHKLFSTPLWHLEGISHELADELYEGAYRFKEKYPAANRSNQGGYQTPSLEWEMFHPLGIEVINKLVYVAIEHDFKVKAWWYNINGKGDLLTNRLLIFDALKMTFRNVNVEFKNIFI